MFKEVVEKMNVDLQVQNVMELPQIKHLMRTPELKPTAVI